MKKVYVILPVDMSILLSFPVGFPLTWEIQRKKKETDCFQ